MWWLGWLFAPHLLVAFLSLAYWHTNPILVITAWIIALGGTGGEGEVAGAPPNDDEHELDDHRALYKETERRNSQFGGRCHVEPACIRRVC